MTSSLEKAKNFCIDALLAHDAQQRADGGDASPGLCFSRSPGDSPVSTRGSETPSPLSNQTVPGPTPAGVLSKARLSSPNFQTHPGFTALHQGGLIGMHPGSMYPLTALGGHHPALMYPGFTQLLQSYPEHLKGPSLSGTVPGLEPWIRAGFMMPKFGEYGGERRS